MNRRDMLRGLTAVAGSLGAGVSPCSRHGAWADEPQPAAARTLELPPGPETGSGRHPTWPSVVRFDSTGERVVAGMESGGNLRVWEAATGRVLDTVQAHRLRIEHLAVSPDGRRVAIAGPGDSIRIDRGLGEAIREIGASIKVWDLETRELVKEVEPPEQAMALAFQAEEPGLLSLSGRGLIRWDLDSGDHQTWLFPDMVDEDDVRAINGAAFDLRGLRVAVATSRRLGESKNLTLWELPTRRVLVMDTRNQIGEPREPVALSSDGQVVAISTFGGSETQRVKGWHRMVAVLSFATGETLNPRRMPVLEPFCEVLEFSPDGAWIATASSSRPSREPDVVRIWHVATGREMTTARCPIERDPERAQALQSQVRAMTFLDDGRLRVVSGGNLWTPQGTAEHVWIPLVVWEIDGPELP